MKKLTCILCSLVVLAAASCQKEKAVKPLTKKEIQKKVDSIMSVRARQMENDARRDLQLRLRIEVKAKADSLLNATTKDTLRKTDTIQTPKI